LSVPGAANGGDERKSETTAKTGKALRGWKVIEITAGRVALEAMDENKETIIIRLEHGKQSTERIRRTPEQKPVFYKPK
jgi:hypothetical protein